MAKKSGFSHAFSALISFIMGYILIAYLKPHFPKIFGPLENTAGKLGEWIGLKMGITISPDVFIPVLVAFFLAFLWGVLYHVARHRGS